MNLENQNAAKKRKNKLGTRRKGFIIAFLAPTLIAFCVFYLYPIITVFITSFCKWDYTNITSPEFFGWSNLWDNYDYIFNKYPFFWEALKNSTTWAILGAVVQIPIAALIALAPVSYTHLDVYKRQVYQIMANELKVGHVKVAILYALLQLAISFGFIYLCPNTVVAHWIYLVFAIVILAVTYGLFMLKYYHLHEEYLVSLKKMTYDTDRQKTDF